MFRNYLKTAWRNLKVNKFYSIINICGLAVGLATGIMLLLWVQDERSYDKFNKDYRNIYRINAEILSGGKPISFPAIPGPMSGFSHTLSQVRSLVRISDEGVQPLANSDHSKVLDGFRTICADSNFFSMFDFKLIQGNRLDIFPDIHAIVITQSTAKKFWGNENALGKTLVYHKTPFIVTGVLQDFPDNSSLQYDAIFPMRYYGQRYTASGGNGEVKTIDEDLDNFSFTGFVQLQGDADPVKVGVLFSSWLKQAKNGKSNIHFKLQNLANIHLISADGNDSARRMVQIFMLVAALLLIIAAINYVNLSTARSLIRAKEVSIRKIVGANKRQLFFQFITETALLFCMAALLTVILINVFMPLYNQLSGKTLHFSLTDARIWSMLGWTILSTWLASGIYPAIVLASPGPVQSIKKRSATRTGPAPFRKMLVIFQFTISMVLIISTWVIGRQMHYIKNKDLGYDKSYVFTVWATDNMAAHITSIKNELRKQPGIINVSTSNIYDITNINNSTDGIDWPGKPKDDHIMISYAEVGKNFIPMMRVQFLEGQDFSGRPADSAHYILNEAAVKMMGLHPPYVGQPVTFQHRKGTIIGVMKDFNFKPLNEKIAPLIFFARWSPSRKGLYIRTTAKDASKAVAAVKRQYEKYAGDTPFNFTFVDKQFETKYRSEERQNMLFNLFAGIAIFISCLGLFGLATFTTQRRTKEIGIRKVLGASVGNVLKIVSKDFIMLVLIAIIIATPIAWLAMNKWLENFAYRINISWWVFVVAGLTAVAIALITVSWQAIKAARANPVKSLRSE